MTDALKPYNISFDVGVPFLHREVFILDAEYEREDMEVACDSLMISFSLRCLDAILIQVACKIISEVLGCICDSFVLEGDHKQNSNEGGLLRRENQ